ncbi:MAG: thiamine transport system substrate-binding protein, partial [Actinomycetota bacterium]|nr:thiamine transport system substrate-binding protein [Actinomycetota bacterium]
MNRSRPFLGKVGLGFIVIMAMTAAACAGSSKPAAKPSKTVVLMTHDSFAASPAVLAQFTRETGFKVKVLKSGDAGKALSQALLVKDHPVADALFGVDNTFLTRALDNNLFEAYAAHG